LEAHVQKRNINLGRVRRVERRLLLPEWADHDALLISQKIFD
jgi:hypothetical protein